MEAKTPETVFPAVGKPTVTYVERASGENERRLANGLRNAGQICLLTGPSKTGKTSLYKAVLPDIQRYPLVIRCSGRLSPSEFWASALEDLDFERLSERAAGWGMSLGAKIGAEGKAGWSWIAKAMASVGFDISASGEYGIKKEVIRSEINAKHLIPLLKEMPLQLIVEDFHYLDDLTKKEVFQQWKAFVDEGVSALVVSTTHHAIDIARANPDLSGRTRFIDMGQWRPEDLAEISRKGFTHLGIKNSEAIRKRIAKESCGLPIITQQICQEIALKHDMSPGSLKRSTNIQKAAVDDALEFVADNLYANHKGDYEQLITGPRKGQRKHASYENILASFALEPLSFSLKHHELMERVAKLSEDKPIPPASISAALKALGNFQERSNLRLLDWHEGERVLYIVEPSFLFYLRQRLDNTAGESITEKLVNFLRLTDINGNPMEVKIQLLERQERLPLGKN